MKQRKQTLRYILLEGDGQIFNRLVENISSHSLTDLLIELMQISVFFQAQPQATHINLEGSDEEETKATDVSEDKSLTQDQQTMKNVLNRDDVLNPDVIKWLDIIKAIANPAAHDFKEDINDYLTAFRAFVSITAWYVDITAPNREEE